MAWEPAGPGVRELNLLYRSVPGSATHSPALGLGAGRFCSWKRQPCLGGASLHPLSADGQLQVTPPPPPIRSQSPHTVHTGLESRAALKELLLGKARSTVPSPCSGTPRGDTGWPGKGETAASITSGSATYLPEHSICLGHAILHICPEVDFSWFSGPSG